MAPEKDYDLSPDKKTFRSWSGDLSLSEAIKELVDNAIDNWTRKSDRQKDVTIDIECDSHETTVVDDTGGISEAEVDALFKMGGSIDQSGSMAIGGYALGAKKAIPRLGCLHQDEFTNAIVKSRAQDADIGYGFIVDAEWFQKPEWTIERSDFTNLEQGTTELIIKSETPVWDKQSIQELRDDLAVTYEKFLLGTARDQNGDFLLRVNGTLIETKTDIDWSFIPIDQLHPRKYEGIQLGTSYLDDGISATVTVGLLRQKDSTNAGTDIYCQDRVVVRNNTGKIGGFGQDENAIGNFTTHDERLKIIVELATTGDPTNLPWGIQKRTIDPTHRVTRDLHANLKVLVTPYFEANADTLPADIAKPYGSNSRYAANEGEVESVSVMAAEGPDHCVSDNNKPVEGFPRIHELKKISQAHGLVGVMIDTSEYELTNQTLITPQEVPAYENLVQSCSEGDTLRPIDSSEGADILEEVDGLYEYIETIENVGGNKVRSLLRGGIHSKSELTAASVDDVASISNIGSTTARKLLADTDEIEHSNNQKQESQTDDSQEAVEKGAMQKAIEYERTKGRKPEDVSGELSEGHGYDIISKDPESGEKLRFIEVKGRSNKNAVTLTETQWKEAQESGEMFWLYVVPRAHQFLKDDREDPPLFPIQNPAEELEPKKEKIDRPRYQYRISFNEWYYNKTNDRQ